MKVNLRVDDEQHILSNRIVADPIQSLRLRIHNRVDSVELSRPQTVVQQLAKIHRFVVLITETFSHPLTTSIKYNMKH